MSQVTVAGLPDWFPHLRLLGEYDWEQQDKTIGEETSKVWVAQMPKEEAADIQARLRKLVLVGHPIGCWVRPSLKRPMVRAARLEDARRRRQRTPGFTKKGVKVDDQAKVYLTPESLALVLGKRALKLGGPLSDGVTVIDACCGAGGNAIGFARAGCHVIAIEPHSKRLRDAKHNAKLYGVDDKISFIEGYAQDHLQTPADLIFLDPPWTDANLQPDLQVMEQLLPHIPPNQRAWWKLPPDFAGLQGYQTEAWFGHSVGDRQRVKFLLLSKDKAST